MCLTRPPRGKTVYVLFELYLTHLAMKGDSSDAKVPQQQRHPLGVVTCAAENHERIAGKLVQDGHQVAVLPQNTHMHSVKRFNIRYH